MIDELIGIQLPLIGIKTGDEEEYDAHLHRRVIQLFHIKNEESPSISQNSIKLTFKSN